MKEDFVNPCTTQIVENLEVSIPNKNTNESFNNTEIIESKTTTFEHNIEENVKALKEGIRLTEIGRDTALVDLERWRNTDTTEPSHFEYHLPEIRNRINRAEHSITSSKLDIDLIKAAPESDKQEDEVVEGFISKQVLDGKTAKLRDKLSSFDKQETDFNEQLDRNHRATEKLQAELDTISIAVKDDKSDSKRLKSIRRDVLAEMDGVLDHYEILMHKKTEIDILTEERGIIRSQIDEIIAAGIKDEELPKSIQEDPDFANCLEEADSYKSEDDREFKRKTNYNPEETAVRLFRNRFPQKHAYYERLITPNESAAETVTEHSLDDTEIDVSKEQINSDVETTTKLSPQTSNETLDTEHFTDSPKKILDELQIEAVDYKPAPEDREGVLDENLVEYRKNQSYSERLSEYLTGMRFDNPHFVEKLEQDQQALRQKYNLPDLRLLTDNPREFERKLRDMAETLGVEIRSKSEFEQYFIEHPYAAGVHFEKEGIVVTDIDEEDIQSYKKSLLTLEHELVHASQHVQAPRMSIELMEYEAYVANGNFDYLNELEPEQLKESLDTYFSFLVGGSVNHWYQNEAEKNGFDKNPEWDNADYFIKKDRQENINAREATDKIKLPRSIKTLMV